MFQCKTCSYQFEKNITAKKYMNIKHTEHVNEINQSVKQNYEKGQNIL